ncbi:unnamed protein product, partial [Effrenium voratum]
MAQDSRASIGGPGSPSGASVVSTEGQIGMLVGLPPKPRPEVVKVHGAWPAHAQPVASLVITGSPPALVTVDTAKEVKVWCTSGDIWGHFSLRRADETAVWPPPHVLATQMALIRIAKGLCGRMGFHISKSEKLLAQRAMPKRSAQRGLTAAERRQQISQRRAEKQRQVAERDAAIATKVPAEAPASAAPEVAKASIARSDDNGSSAQESLDAGIDEELIAILVPDEGAALDAEEAKQVEEGAESDREEAEMQAEEAQAEAEAGSQAAAPGVTRRAFTAQQMREMIRGHAFSSGFHSYKQFASRPQPQDEGLRPRGKNAQDMEAQKRRFQSRNPNIFSVRLATDSEKEAWQLAKSCNRSASEGTLLRYAQNRVEDMTRAVKKSLGVDVTKTTRHRMRRPSFVSNLDIGHVSQDPSNENSATGQAVKKLAGSRSAQSLLN